MAKLTETIEASGYADALDKMTDGFLALIRAYRSRKVERIGARYRASYRHRGELVICDHPTREDAERWLAAVLTGSSLGSDPDRSDPSTDPTGKNPSDSTESR